MTERPEVVCLCGSLRFAVEMIAASDQLALEGSIALSPAFLTAVANGDRPALSAEEREALGELHLRRIDLTNRVLVVNPGGYLGGVDAAGDRPCPRSRESGVVHRPGLSSRSTSRTTWRTH